MQTANVMIGVRSVRAHEPVRQGHCGRGKGRSAGSARSVALHERREDDRSVVRFRGMDAPTHAEFIRACEAREIVWGVHGLFRSVRLVWASRSGRRIAILVAWCLAPIVAVVALSIKASAPLLLLWLLPIGLAVLAGTPGLSLLGLIFWTICGSVSAGVSIVWGARQPRGVHGLADCGEVASNASPHLSQVAAFSAFCAIALPIVWVVACAVKGTTMIAIEGELRRSREAYDRLVEAGILFVWRLPPPTLRDDRPSAASSSATEQPDAPVAADSTRLDARTREPYNGRCDLSSASGS
jgi:hypothetical protein